MSIEEEIRQEKFGSEHHKAAINILFTSSWVYRRNAARLKPFGITPEQYNVMRILRGSLPAPMRLADIACRMIDRSSNATRLVEKLRTKGLVKRERCEDNRRAVDIWITDKGMALMKAIDEREHEWVASFRSISSSEAKELNRLLDKLRS